MAFDVIICPHTFRYRLEDLKHVCEEELIERVDVSLMIFYYYAASIIAYLQTKIALN